VRREIGTRRIDLLVLAMKPASLSTRRILRMVGSILDDASCDVLVFRNHARCGLDRAELLPSPPW
jgi:hypothetical protein